jgi:uncharacterized membrane protein YfcA
MDLSTILMLVGAGIAGGALSALVGGAALITFPALLAAGLPPVSAIVANLTALVPANFLAALDDRRVLPPIGMRFIGIVVASVIAATAGAALLLLTPERMFAVLVPLLLGFATVLFALGPGVSRWMRERALARRGQEPDIGRTHLGMLLPVSFYGGYFGAGVGVLLLAVLSIGTKGDYRSANVAKNLVTSLNSLVAAIYFSLQGAVNWRPALTLMAGALAGGLLGARVARYAPRNVMRWVVVAVGALLTVVYAWRYWS